MRIVRIGEQYSIVGSTVETYDLLPVQTYVTLYSKDEGFFLKEHPNIAVTEKIYGVHEKKAKKVLDSFEVFKRSLGVILSGDKGIGKSIFAKLLCQRAISQGYPVIIVDEALPGIARFIESIEQECIVLFDEFDKTFRTNRENDEQAKLLSLFDGTAGGKKMYIVTCNELYGLNDYIVNRPGRFHYHFRFSYPTATDIREYLRDNVIEKVYGEIDKVIAFSGRINLNYDCLRAIAFELNQGSDFKEAVADLNILNVNREDYNVTLYYETGEMLHQYRFRTNLYSNDENFSWITLYDESEHEVAEVRFNKRNIVYDTAQKSLIIPGDKLKLDYEDCDEDVDVEKYRGLKVAYISFVKCDERRLHYAV